MMGFLEMINRILLAVVESWSAKQVIFLKQVNEHSSIARQTRYGDIDIIGVLNLTWMNIINSVPDTIFADVWTQKNLGNSSLPHNQN
jgi:hypothetical protein